MSPVDLSALLARWWRRLRSMLRPEPAPAVVEVPVAPVAPVPKAPRPPPYRTPELASAEVVGPFNEVTVNAILCAMCGNRSWERPSARAYLRTVRLDPSLRWALRVVAAGRWFFQYHYATVVLFWDADRTLLFAPREWPGLACVRFEEIRCVSAPREFDGDSLYAWVARARGTGFGTNETLPELPSSCEWVDLAPAMRDLLIDAVAPGREDDLAASIWLIELLATRRGYGTQELGDWIKNETGGFTALRGEVRLGESPPLAPGELHRRDATLVRHVRIDSTPDGYHMQQVHASLTITEDAWRYEREVILAHHEPSVEMS